MGRNAPAHRGAIGILSRVLERVREAFHLGGVLPEVQRDFAKCQIAQKQQLSCPLRFRP
jgi:hypothetical protein